MLPREKTGQVAPYCGLRASVINGLFLFQLILMFYYTTAETFCRCLSRLRNIHGLTQKTLALAADMDQSYVAGLETGRRPPPRDKQLLRLASALNAAPTEIAQLFEARAVSKMATIGSQITRPNCSPLMQLITATTGMTVTELHALEQIAHTLRSLRCGNHNGGAT